MLIVAKVECPKFEKDANDDDASKISKRLTQ